MAARLARQLATVAQCLAGGLNRVDDPAVSGAAADMSVERLSNRLAVAALPLFHEMRGANDNARDTEATLNAAFEHERLADDLPGSLGKPVDGLDVVAGHLLRLSQTRQRGLAVDHHEAAAARTFWRTPVLARGNAAFFAQHLQQMHSGFVVGFGFLVVQLEGNPGH